MMTITLIPTPASTPHHIMMRLDWPVKGTSDKGAVVALHEDVAFDWLGRGSLRDYVFAALDRGDEVTFTVELKEG